MVSVSDVIQSFVISCYDFRQMMSVHLDVLAWDDLGICGTDL